MDRIGQSQPRFDAIEVGGVGLGPGRHRVPGYRTRAVEFDLDASCEGRAVEAHGQGRHALQTMEAVDDLLVVEGVAGSARLRVADLSVFELAAACRRRQCERRVRTQRVRQGEVEMVAGVVGQRGIAAIRRAQRDFEHVRVH